MKKTIVILLEIIRTTPRSLSALKDSVRRSHPEISDTLVGDVCQQYKIQFKKKLDRFLIFEYAVEISRKYREKTGSNFVFHFGANQHYCSSCHTQTEYYKTTRKRCFDTIRYGKIHFRESLVKCPRHQCDPKKSGSLTFGSTFLRSLVPPGSSIGYDVIVFIGKERFVAYRQIEEIRTEMHRTGINISSSSITRRCDFFLAAIECLHYTRLRKLRLLIQSNGGYILHIDATTETKSDTVFVCVDRCLGTVLLSEKISSENQDEVEKILRRLKRYFGDPIVIMRDMSDSFGKAIMEVFPDVPDRICQFHFLKDIGKDLLGKLYVQLGHTIAKLKINPSLRKLKRELEKGLTESKVSEASVFFSDIESLEQIPTATVRKYEDFLALCLVNWILEYTHDGSGWGFPFDLYRVLYFNRINLARLRLSRYFIRHPRTVKNCPTLMTLYKCISHSENQDLRREVRDTKAIHRIFDELRSVLRFEFSARTPLAATLSVGTLKEIKSYNRALTKYTKDLIKAHENDTISEPEEVILKHLVKHQFKLPIPEQLAELLLDRTNNFLEGLFRGSKKGQRRQSGKKDISMEFGYHGPYLPLMLNLSNDHYVSAVIGQHDDLPIRISELDSSDIQHYLRKIYESRRGKFFEHVNNINAIEMLPTGT